MNFLNLKRSLYFDELPKNFQLSGIEFSIEFSRVDNGFFQKETNSFDVFVDINIFFRNDIVGALLFFNDYTVSFLKDDKKNIYIFDSHGRDSFGQPSPEGKSILMSFLSFRNVLQYLTNTYESITYIQIVYVKIHPLDEERKKALLKDFSLYKKRIQSREKYLTQSEHRKDQSKKPYICKNS